MKTILRVAPVCVERKLGSKERENLLGRLIGAVLVAVRARVEAWKSGRGKCQGGGCFPTFLLVRAISWFVIGRDF